MLQHKINPKN